MSEGKFTVMRDVLEEAGCHDTCVVEWQRLDLQMAYVCHHYSADVGRNPEARMLFSDKDRQEKPASWLFDTVLARLKADHRYWWGEDECADAPVAAPEAAGGAKEGA